jgi:PAS domain S-box-containing protein
LNAVAVGIIILGKGKGNIVLANGAAKKLFGRKKMAGIRIPIYSKTLKFCRITGEKYSFEDFPSTRSLLNGEEIRGEQILMKKRGKNIIVSVDSQSLRAGNKKIGAVLSLREITKLKNTQKGLKKNKLRDKKKIESVYNQLDTTKRLADIGTLAGIVAHELRNPLGVISASIYNIKRKTGEKNLAKHIRNVEKKIKESEAVINNLLDYSRLKKPIVKKCGVRRLIEESLENASAQLPGKKIRVKKDLRQLDKAYIEADPHQISHIFMNIVNNAFEAAPEKNGMVDIKGAKSRLNGKNVLSVTIADNGPGISKHIREKIFNPFFSTKSKGTGLGLAVCVQFAGLYGGTVKIDEKKRKGASFIVTLPLAG